MYKQPPYGDAWWLFVHPPRAWEKITLVILLVDSFRSQRITVIRAGCLHCHVHSEETVYFMRT